MESISSQQRIGKYNKVHVITAHRDRNIVRKNIQENRYIFNQTRKSQAIQNTLIISPTKPTTAYHIGKVVRSPLISDWYDSI